MGGVPALCAARAPTTRSARSPGVTTRQPGVSAVRKFGSIAPPKTKSSASRARPGVVAEEHRAAERVGDLGDRRRGEGGLVRQHVTGHGQAGVEAARRSRRGPRGRPGWRPWRGRRSPAPRTRGRRCASPRAPTRRSGRVPPTTAIDGRAELVGEAGVEGQLVRELGVGEVGAEDEDDVVVAGDARGSGRRGWRRARRCPARPGARTPPGSPCRTRSPGPGRGGSGRAAARRDGPGLSCTRGRKTPTRSTCRVRSSMTPSSTTWRPSPRSIPVTYTLRRHACSPFPCSAGIVPSRCLRCTYAARREWRRNAS